MDVHDGLIQRLDVVIRQAEASETSGRIRGNEPQGAGHVPELFHRLGLDGLQRLLQLVIIFEGNKRLAMRIVCPGMAHVLLIHLIGEDAIHFLLGGVQRLPNPFADILFCHAQLLQP